MSAVTIARHEVRASFRDGRLRWFMLITLVLLLAASACGWHYQKELTAERESAQAIEQQRWLGQGSKNAHSAAHYGIYAFKPASSLTAIDQGIDPFAGVSVWLEAHHMDQLVYRPAQDATTLTRFGELTAALILQMLLPLLIVLITFGAFAGERERGTLRLLLSQGVASRSLATGKVLGTAAVLGIFIVPAAVLGIVAISVSAGTEVPAASLRLSLLLLVYLAYLIGWALLALAISAWASTSRTALVLLVGAWVLGCIALPRAASDVVGWLHPVPTAAEFVAGMEHDLDEEHASERARVRRERVLREHGVSRIEDLPIDWRGISLQEEEERSNPIFDVHYGALFDRYREQSTGLQVVGLFAPLLTVQALSEVLTGTDIEQHRRFVFAAEAHRRVMQRVLNAEVTLRDREDRPDSLSGAELWNRVPRFAYAPPPLGSMLTHYWVAFTALTVWVLVTATAAAVAVRRLRP